MHQSDQCLVNQREIGSHITGYTRGLKSALREDPDIVMVGELRDLETISLALDTANTGHLVFATLHTNTAVSTVDRIVDQFPAGEQAQIRSSSPRWSKVARSSSPTRSLTRWTRRIWKSASEPG